jgi:hypothetical protein
MYVHTNVSLQSKCRLCGMRTVGPLCAGGAERLELDLAHDPTRACPACGRHLEFSRTGFNPSTISRWLRRQHIDR